MVLVQPVAQAQDLVIAAFVEQVEAHTGSTVALQQHFALEDCSESQFQQCQRQHIEPQYHHLVVHLVLLSVFREAVESLEMLL